MLNYDTRWPRRMRTQQDVPSDPSSEPTGNIGNWSPVGRRWNSCAGPIVMCMVERERYTPTRAELESMAGHASYELEQLRLAIDTLGMFDGSDRRGWLIAQAGLIHARNLIEFLFYPSLAPRPHQSATARAVWYTDTWSPYRRRAEFEAQIGTGIEEIKGRIDRRVCHLSVDRDHTPLVPFWEIGPAVDLVWRAMHANLRHEWRDRFPL